MAERRFSNRVGWSHSCSPINVTRMFRKNSGLGPDRHGRFERFGHRRRRDRWTTHFHITKSEHNAIFTVWDAFFHAQRFSPADEKMVFKKKVPTLNVGHASGFFAVR